ncbi:MAG TPA: hypothetical protein VEB59_00025, partial [Gemmatimonadales bacterium]|nr:hypothetical protein [Gemmatimonadales bacterium]
MLGILPVALLLQAGATPLAAAPAPAGRAIAESYERTYDEVMGMRPLADKAAQVQDLVIVRDAARFTLKRGTMHLVSPVNGRTVAAVFHGAGAFALRPTNPIERRRLARIESAESIDAPVTDVVFFFADSTLAQLERTLAFASGPVTGELRDRIEDALELVGDRDTRTIDPDLMAAMLNGEDNDLFYACIRRQSGGPLLFMLNPNEVESVRLAGRVTRRVWSRATEMITQFPRNGGVRPAGATGDRTRQADVQRYVIETWLPQTGMGEIGFSAAATLEIIADQPVGPWVTFELFDRLKVDSARWAGGEPATVFRAKDADLLWVKLDGRIRPGDVRTLQLWYHGDLIDRFEDFFQIKSSAAWYPRSLEGRSLARFDLTFHTWD